MEANRTKTGTLLNAYGDSMGGQLSDIVQVLKKKEFENAFESVEDSAQINLDSDYKKEENAQ